MRFPPASILIAALLAPAALAQTNAQTPRKPVTYRQAQKLYKEAYAMGGQEYAKALEKLKRIIEDIPQDCPVHCKARRLKAAILGEPIPECSQTPGRQGLPPHCDRGIGNLAAKVRALIVSGKINEALPLIDKGIKLEPNNCEWHLMNGIARARIGQQKKAAVAYQRFTELCPDHPKAQQVSKFLQEYREYQKNH